MVAGISQKIGVRTNNSVVLVSPGASYKPPKGWDLDCFIRRNGTAIKFWSFIGWTQEKTNKDVKKEFKQYIGKAKKLLEKNPKPEEATQPPIQRAATSSEPIDDVMPVVNEVVRSEGLPLDNSTRAFMESRFGHNFTNVRVHTDSRATEAARAVNARAFTMGRDVVFGKGEYAPEAIQGKRLLAHELTHVLQQCNVTLQPGVDTAQSDDGIGYEDNIAKSVSQGKELMPSAPLRVQRFFGQCDPFRPVDCFIQQFIGQIPQLIEEATIGQVELVCKWVIGVTGAAAVVFSLRGQIGVGAGSPVEGGVELIYARNLGWLTYGHFGAGLGTSGGAVEVGLIWNLTDPGAYEGSFMELAVGYYGGTVSFSGNLSDASCEEESPQAIKFGIGTPGGSILYEQYMQISGQRRPAVAR